jgi:hypothetical protein
MAPRRLSLAEEFDRIRRPGNREPLEETTDYSSVVEEAGEAEKRRERRKWGALLGGAHLFWLYALLLAGIVLILYFVLR